MFSNKELTSRTKSGDPKSFWYDIGTYDVTLSNPHTKIVIGFDANAFPEDSAAKNLLVYGIPTDMFKVSLFVSNEYQGSVVKYLQSLSSQSLCYTIGQSLGV